MSILVNYSGVTNTRPLAAGGSDLTLLRNRLLAEADDEARALLAEVRFADGDDALYRDVEHLVILINQVRHAFVNLHELAAQGRRAAAEQVNLLPHQLQQNLSHRFSAPPRTVNREP